MSKFSKIRIISNELTYNNHFKKFCINCLFSFPNSKLFKNPKKAFLLLKQ
ncbi:unnamed protein product [Brugia timori]|uniref:Uncharacterized protein n=1 Tax=Brugia timori TaxID=42155 RepID=A0A0R3QY30_9BILA|nr:unnamed protein product [Brugia timori]